MRQEVKLQMGDASATLKVAWNDAPVKGFQERHGVSIEEVFVDMMVKEIRACITPELLLSLQEQHKVANA